MSSMRRKWNRRTIVFNVVIFIVLPLCVGGLTMIRMLHVLHTYMEDQVSLQATLVNEIASLRLESRLDELNRVARFLRDGRVDEDSMGGTAARLLSAGYASIGIIRLDGTPVSGQPLKPGEYPAIQSTFRGKGMVRYRAGEGLLFTAPIYNGENVKYALYEFVEQSEEFISLGDHWYGDEGELLLVDTQQRVYLPLSRSARIDAGTLFSIPQVQEAQRRLSERLSLSSVSTVFFRIGWEGFFLTAADLNQPNLYLAGFVSHDMVSGQLRSLAPIVFAVFGLLLALLAIGVFRILSVDARARESDALREAKELAEQASESRGRFLANMSHELRTPINTILGMNEMVLRETSEDNTRERAMDVKSSAQILLGLINDVLDFSRIESGMLTILPVDYDLSGLVRNLSLLSDNRARAKSLIYEAEIEPSLPLKLYGDDIRIQQVLANLLTNAVKYTSAGTITLRMSGSRTGDDNIILHCEVSDTGMGIKPEDIEKLYSLTPFTRVDENRNRSVEGSGLGLPIIVNLLHLMDSQLHIDSVYGEGSKFWFDLPQKIVSAEPIGDIRKRLEQQAREYEYRTALYAPKAKIMVVDDNSLNRKIFVSLLKETGIQITTASSGFKCLELVQDERFDLIFMDHLMPEMDGLETFKRLQSLENNLCKSTPVIALTANAFVEVRDMFLAAGFNAFMSKPIVSEKLEALLLKMLPSELLEKEPPRAQRKRETEFPAFEGVDWDFALLHLADRDLLLSMLRDFARSLEREMETLTALEQKLDTPEGVSSYRTRVHALKSTAATVGVLSVSELARLLEAAAVAGDRAKIERLSPVLMEELERTKERLSPLTADSKERKPLEEKEQLADILELLRSALADMDIAQSDALCAQLDSYEYAPNLREPVQELIEAVSSLDFDLADTLSSELLHQLAGI